MGYPAFLWVDMGYRQSIQPKKTPPTAHAELSEPGGVGKIRFMGRKRKPVQPESGQEATYHATLHGALALALDDYHEATHGDRMDFVRQAVREKLEALGYWPRKQIVTASS